MPSYYLGTAFGIVFAASNAGLVIGPLVVGFLQENTTEQGGFFWVSIFLIFQGTVGLMAAVVIYVYDMMHSKILDTGKDENQEKSWDKQTQEKCMTLV